MATAESVSAKIRNLIDMSNQTTGGSSTNLTDAVSRLVNGYGAGGLNAPLKQYKVASGQSVGAGNFVEFERNWGGGVICDNQSSDRVVTAAILDEDRVFVAYADKNDDNYIYAKVLSVDGPTVISGTPIKLPGKVGGALYINDFLTAVALNDHQVLVGARKLYTQSQVCLITVDGLELSANTSAGSVLDLNSNGTEDGAVYELRLTALSETKVLAVYHNKKDKGFAVELSLYGTDIARGNVLQFASGVKNLSVTTLAEDTALLVYMEYDWSTSTAGQGYGKVLTIASDGTVSPGSACSLCTSPPQYVVVTALNRYRAIMLCQDTSTSYSSRPVARLLKIADTAVSTTWSVQLSTSVGSFCEIVALDHERALALYNKNSASAVVAVLTAKDSKLENGGELLVAQVMSGIGAKYSRLLAFSPDNVLLVGSLGTKELDSYSTYTPARYRQIKIDGAVASTVPMDTAGGTTVRQATSNKHNVGLAKTGGSDGATVDVYRAF